ncbi:GPN-loop GTPase 2 [Platysternon megacephalum]|uniref:GPN-loop GTPase 2 n=1 Tax=Platysternon megacephalum TaxID=55544 RepID=A0A4D9F7C1_9SAUR|nr:GPN-loop GTPase 2 [Platysternon megacephalum]
MIYSTFSYQLEWKLRPKICQQVEPEQKYYLPYSPQNIAETSQKIFGRLANSGFPTLHGIFCQQTSGESWVEILMASRSKPLNPSKGVEVGIDRDSWSAWYLMDS